MNAIPTVYNGIQFRSRLEARWACMFDLLGWKYQYEPFDLDGWIPDFVIFGIDGEILVEVKPVVEFPKDMANKIKSSGWDGSSLIVGCAFINSKWDQNVFGWMKERNNPRWEQACFYGEMERIGFSCQLGRWFDRIYEHNGLYPLNGWSDEINRESIRLWNRAGNTVQYRGIQSATGL